MTPILPRKKYIGSDATVVTLTAAMWLSFFLMNPPEVAVSLPSYVFFAVGAGLFSFLLLGILGYFDPLRLIPRKSDVFLVMGALPLGGLIQQTIFEYVVHVRLWEVKTLFLYTPLLSFAIFGPHYVWRKLKLNLGHKKQVVLELLPHERSRVIADFFEYGIGNHISFLTLADLKRKLLEGRVTDIDLVIISGSTVKHFDTDATLVRAHLAGIPVVDHRTISMDLTGRICLENTDLWTYVMSATPQTSLLRAWSHIKVITEPVAALVLAILFFPVGVIIAGLVKVTSEGPIFYRQIRTGYQGKQFMLVKFRSMCSDSEKNGPQWCSGDSDSRITPLGRILRKTRLDELPQLWNVLRGEMSFFGPRPERPEIYAQLKKEIPLFSLRTIVRPGITGWAQVTAGYAASIEESRTKLEYDLYYIQNMSPRLEIIILIKTVLVALLGAERPASVVVEADPIEETGNTTADHKVVA